MSGWIKFWKDMPNDPRVLAAALKLSERYVLAERTAGGGADLSRNALCNAWRNAVVGALATLWSYADEHIRDDDTLPLTSQTVDAVVGLEGFFDAMPREWIDELDDGSVILPGYCEKNSLIAKRKRAVKSNARVTRWRRGNKSQRNGVTGTHVTQHTVAGDLDQDLDLKNKDMAAERPFVSARFADFWAAYPQKVKKKDAQKVWQSKRLDGMADVLIADVKRRLSEDRRWVGGYVCDPPVYLRGERWNDAIEPVQKNGNGQHAADAAAKERTQILDLASMFGIEQRHGEDWPTFKARVDVANTRRLESLGRSQ